MIALVWTTLGGAGERALFDNSHASDWSVDGRVIVSSYGPPPGGIWALDRVDR